MQLLWQAVRATTLETIAVVLLVCTILHVPSVVSGPLSVVSGPSSVVRGPSSVVRGPWSVASGQLVGQWSVASGQLSELADLSEVRSPLQLHPPRATNH